MKRSYKYRILVAANSYTKARKGKKRRKRRRRGSSGSNSSRGEVEEAVVLWLCGMAVFSRQVQQGLRRASEAFPAQEKSLKLAAKAVPLTWALTY